MGNVPTQHQGTLQITWQHNQCRLQKLCTKIKIECHGNLTDSIVLLHNNTDSHVSYSTAATECRAKGASTRLYMVITQKTTL